MRKLHVLLLAGALLCGATACREKTTPAGEGAAAPSGDVPLFSGLGTHRRAVSGASAEGQRYFDQGLSFVFGFNHDEAIRAFRRAAQADPACAMAWWGVAYSYGPHINNTAVAPERAAAAWEALGRARDAAAGANEVERGLIEALAKRYASPQPEDRKPLDTAYAEAMRELWHAHPADADVGALTAEALMDLRPWDFWTADGQPQPGTEELLATLDAVLALDPRHPLANHLYVHAVEASPHPERADAAANVLRDLTPGLGHMVHMPSHIDVRRGRWEEAIVANRKAMQVDAEYRKISPQQDFYRLYMAHNHHMLTFAAMMTGQGALALETIRAMVAGIPTDWLRDNAVFADGFAGMPYEVLMRFGKWDEILAEPEPPEYLPVSRAMRLYARGVAHAAQGRVAEARAEQQQFLAALAAVGEEVTFGNNPARTILAVAEALLDGEILFRDGQRDQGLERLREAVRLEDALRYDEPPDWIQPVRHALGAALLQAGRHEQAEKVYREDLARLPENGWSLFGLGRTLRLLGREPEAAEVEARFEKVWAGADVTLASSCFCQPGV